MTETVYQNTEDNFHSENTPGIDSLTYYKNPDNKLDGKTFLSYVSSDPEKAFELLVNLYRQEIYDLCVRVSGDRTEAEDISQETFIKAYERLDGFRGEAAPRTWLYRIAINRSITFKRRLKRWQMKRGNDQEIFPEDIGYSTASDEKMVVEKDLAAHAQKALDKLPQRQKAAVILRVKKEMPYEEIANVMGISVGGAKANVHQGIKKLRQWL